jgi:hypothetical protein
VAARHGRAVTVNFVKSLKVKGARVLRCTLRIRLVARPTKIRVRDAAGNWSRWRVLK